MFSNPLSNSSLLLSWAGAVVRSSSSFSASGSLASSSSSHASATFGFCFGFGLLFVDDDEAVVMDVVPDPVSVVVVLPVSGVVSPPS